MLTLFEIRAASSEDPMRRILLGLVIGLPFVPRIGIAQDALIRLCDLSAASPLDQSRPADIAGIAFEKIDPKAALPACQAALAAASENPRLQFQMARVYQVTKDDSKARALYEKAANQGYALAQYNLAWMYDHGLGGVPKNEQEAARLYKLAADQGNAAAQYNLGLDYRDGLGGLQKNDQEAARLFKLAADQGNAPAQNNLGLFCENGRGGLPKNEQEAARLYKLAADQGHAAAQYNLGLFYENGRGGLPKNEQEAARLYKLAADRGYAAAQSILGWFYDNGHGGLPKNEQEAARLYKLAADQGHAAAQYNLGVDYRDGLGGLQKNDQEAARLFKLAADQGNPAAQNNLGLFYENGLGGLPRNEQEAARLYKLAADQGIAVAQNNFDRLYARDHPSDRPDHSDALSQIARVIARDSNLKISGLQYENGYKDRDKYIVIATWIETAKKSSAQLRKEALEWADKVRRDPHATQNEREAAMLAGTLAIMGNSGLSQKLGSPDVEAGKPVSKRASFRFISTENGWLLSGVVR